MQLHLHILIFHFTQITKVPQNKFYKVINFNPYEYVETGLFRLECHFWVIFLISKQNPKCFPLDVADAKCSFAFFALFFQCGRKLAEDPANHSGSLGIAISEAVEVAAKNSNTAYALGSVLNHVLLHQVDCQPQIKKNSIMQLHHSGSARTPKQLSLGSSFISQKSGNQNQRHNLLD